jgi:hypothetical protein
METHKIIFQNFNPNNLIEYYIIKLEK